MAKSEYQFDDFLSEVTSDFKEFVTAIHESLIGDGYKLKVESKASGFFTSYSHPKTKRSLVNFFFRKKGLYTRIYVDNISKHSDFLNSLSDTMKKEITKSPVCKRLVNPVECNPKCIMGYDFSIDDNHYQKCRYSCFQFYVNPESVPVIIEFVELERKDRQE